MKYTTVLAALVAILPVAANAYCSERDEYSFERQVSERMKWLLCLHNEQSDTLNSHAASINNGSDNGIRNNKRIILLVNAVAELSSELDVIRSDQEAMELALKSLVEENEALRIEQTRVKTLNSGPEAD